MADVFISYDEDSAEDVARQIAETLEKSGISCWYAGRDMAKGLLRGAITKAIRDCHVFLLILNEKALESAYVQSEIALAVRGFDDNRERELVAFRVDNVGANAQLDAFLDELRARDDFPPDIAPFQIMDGCPISPGNLWLLQVKINDLLYPLMSSVVHFNDGESSPIRRFNRIVTQTNVFRKIRMGEYHVDSPSNKKKSRETFVENTMFPSKKPS